MMKSLKLFHGWLKKLQRKNDKTYGDVNEAETFVRYLFQSNQFSIDKHCVKRQAFMPPRNLELSVTRHVEASDELIWQIGNDVGNERKLIVKARADLTVAACIKEKLKVVSDPICNNPRHAVIVDWPSEKSAQKVIAQTLAAKATLKMATKSA